MLRRGHGSTVHPAKFCFSFSSRNQLLLLLLLRCISFLLQISSRVRYAVPPLVSEKVGAAIQYPCRRMRRLWQQKLPTSAGKRTHASLRLNLQPPAALYWDATAECLSNVSTHPISFPKDEILGVEHHFDVPRSVFKLRNPGWTNQIATQSWLDQSDSYMVLVGPIRQLYTPGWTNQIVRPSTLL